MAAWMPHSMRISMYTGNLTKEAIESAKQNREHYAIQALSSFGEGYWSKFARELQSTADNQLQQKACRRIVIPIARALEDQQFTLKPLEIVSIWPHISDPFYPPSNYLGYDLSEALSWTYAIRGIKASAWKSLFYLDTSF